MFKGLSVHVSEPQQHTNHCIRGRKLTANQYAIELSQAAMHEQSLLTTFPYRRSTKHKNSSKSPKIYSPCQQTHPNTTTLRQHKKETHFYRTARTSTDGKKFLNYSLAYTVGEWPISPRRSQASEQPSPRLLNPFLQSSNNERMPSTGFASPKKQRVTVRSNLRGNILTTQGQASIDGNLKKRKPINLCKSDAMSDYSSTWQQVPTETHIPPKQILVELPKLGQSHH